MFVTIRQKEEKIGNYRQSSLLSNVEKIVYEYEKRITMSIKNV